MANRISAWISIGGTLTAAQYPTLVDHITAEALSLEWDGEPFEGGDRVEGEALKLHAHEVAGGEFDNLERWLIAHHLPFVRWSGGYGAEWNAEIIVYTGSGLPTCYMADESEQVIVDRDTVEHLGSMEALLAHFDAADFRVPPLAVIGEDPATDRATA